MDIASHRAVARNPVPRALEARGRVTTQRRGRIPSSDIRHPDPALTRHARAFAVALQHRDWAERNEVSYLDLWAMIEASEPPRPLTPDAILCCLVRAYLGVAGAR